jgi:tellurite resistance protein TerC
VIPIVSPRLLWTGLFVVLAVCLAVDLWAHRRPVRVGLRDAAIWTAVWVGVAMTGAVAILVQLGRESFVQFLASYTAEWSLSVDNVFVFVVLLAGLAVPERLRFRVLFFGSLGAVGLRLVFIMAGSALLARFGWVTYVFGALLLVAAFRFLREPAGDEPDGMAEPGMLVRLARRYLPGASSPLLLPLALVAVTDVVFATDSIPAVFAMTRDPFLAFASNALAVVGLRSIYFLLEAALPRFRYLKPALVTLLTFIGLKMLIDPLVDQDLPVAVSLVVMVAVLGTAALASWVLPDRRAAGLIPRPAAAVAEDTKG